MRAAPLLALVLLAGCGAQPSADRPRAGPAHFAVAAERPRSAQPQGRWATARVLRRTALRAAPGGRAVGRLRRRTEFGSPKVVSVLRRRGGWLRVVVPERANGRPAWIRAAATRPGAVDVSLHVDRSARRLTVRRGSKVLRRVRDRRRAPRHGDADGPLRRHGQAAHPARRLALRVLRDRALGPSAEAAAGLAGRRPARAPRHAADGDHREGRIARLPPRQDPRSAGALADRAARRPGFRQFVNTVSITAGPGPSTRV